MPKVLVVDDSAFMRRAIKTMLIADPAVEVVDVGHNGVEAVELAKKHQPDVITLDIEMPEMDGLTALRKIMRECPTQVIMFSSLTSEGSDATMKALRLGAADFMTKEHSTFSLNISSQQDELISKVKALAASNRHRQPGGFKSVGSAQTPVKSSATFKPNPFDLIAIGSSTGGPPILELIIEAIPANLKQPVIIAQHMPEVFTQSMASRLGNSCALPVIHAQDGVPIKPGTVYICPGGQHSIIESKPGGRVVFKTGVQASGKLYKPSVDVLFSSAASIYKNRVLGMVLTGIGDDGRVGSSDIKAAGGQIIAQSKETSVVYGMPRAVAEAGLISAALSPEALADIFKKMATATNQAA